MAHRTRSPKIRLASALAACTAVVALAPGCATNPVTGKSELTLIPLAQEVAIGEQQYLPTRQMQGGDYTADAELTVYVQEIGQRLVSASPRSELPYEFVVLNNGVPNAWALPGGKIAVNRGLLVELENEAQLAAVLGHEIIHAAARHGAKSMERQILLQGALGAVAIGARGTQFENLAVGGATVGAQLTSLKYGRDAESESDLYGMEVMARAGYDPEAAVELQEIFVRLTGGRETSWTEGLLASHPPSQERVEANRVTLARLRKEAGPAASSWTLGEERYAAHLAGLKKDAEAYAAYDQGRAALATGDAAAAARLADQAIRGEPKEARFYGLRSAAELAQGRNKRAVADADRAIALDANYYEPYLQRGLAKRDLGDGDGARADLAASLALLPTAAGHVELGALAENAGQADAAAEHYRAVAEAGGAWGERAAVSLARIEVPREPGRWIAVRGVRDQRGFLVIEIANRAPIPVAGVEIEITRPVAGARGPKSDRLPIPGKLAPGESQRRRTNIGPLADAEALAAVTLRVVAATPR